MKGFFETRTRQQVLEIIARFGPVGTETAASAKASGRVLSAEVKSPCDLPHFDRAMMDGYAVRAEDVSGASPDTPVTLRVAGRVAMGKPAECAVEIGTAVEIATGGALPADADAVVMIEYTERLADDTIAVTRPVARYDNMMRAGEDYRQGEPVLPAGKRLAPKDISALVSLGVSEVEVFKRPAVAIMSTGDELVPHEQKPPLGQVRESNGVVLTALVERDGGTAINMGIVKDDLAKLTESTQQGLSDADVVLISGGSSVGARDLTLAVLESFENSEVLVHGVATRPGKPTIVVAVGGKPVVGLPGHPVSSLVAYEVVVRPLLERLSGCAESVVHARSGSVLRARLDQRVPALMGRDEYVRVRLERRADELVAVPLGRASGATSTLADADGWVLVDMNTEGLEAGEEVEVTLF
jgi:molybdopterin molybdotransferase